MKVPFTRLFRFQRLFWSTSGCFLFMPELLCLTTCHIARLFFMSGLWCNQGSSTGVGTILRRGFSRRSTEGRLCAGLLASTYFPGLCGSSRIVFFFMTGKCFPVLTISWWGASVWRNRNGRIYAHFQSSFVLYPQIYSAAWDDLIICTSWNRWHCYFWCACHVSGRRRSLGLVAESAGTLGFAVSDGKFHSETAWVSMFTGYVTIIQPNIHDSVDGVYNDVYFSLRNKKKCWPAVLLSQVQIGQV